MDSMFYETHIKLHTYLLENGFAAADTNSHEMIRNFNADNLLYEMTACLTVTWYDELNTLYKIIDGFLCIANFYQDGDFSFFIVHSACADKKCEKNNLQQIINTLYDISIRAGLNSLPVWGIEERFLDDYRQLKGYNIETGYNDNMSEYVFKAENLLNLQGSVNEEKRRQLRKFMDRPDISLHIMTKENVKLCLEIENQWCSLQDCNLCKSFAGCSKRTLEIMTDIFDGSIYQGILGYIDGKLEGYIIFEKISEDLVYFYFAKTTASNFSVYLYYICVQRYMSKAVKINIGADLGINGLKLFKRRLGIYDLQKKYFCNFIKEG